MPLPRYNPSEVRLQTGAGIAENAQAQTWQNLSSKLDGWSNIIYKEGADIRTREGKEQATIDVQSGKFNPESDPYSFYDKAYSDAGHTAYNAKMQVDAKNYADTIAVQFENDPEGFRTAFESYTTTMEKEAPNEYSRALTSHQFSKYGVAKYTALTEVRNKKVNENNKNAFESGIKLLKEEYVVAAKNGDVDEASRIAQQMASMYATGMKELWTDENTAQYEVKQLGKEAFVERSLAEFNDTDDKLDYIEKFRENTALSDEETEKAVKRLANRIDEEVSLRKNQEELEDLDFEEKKEAALDNIRENLANGTLTDKDIEEAYVLDYINTSDADNYKSRMQSATIYESNPHVKFGYDRNPLQFSEYEIMNDISLSYKDRIAVREERRKLQKDAEDWRGKETGKQAIKKINNLFGVVSSDPFSAVLMKQELKQDYAEFYDRFYDEVNALPLDKKESGVLSVTNKLISDYRAGKMEGVTTYIDPNKPKEDKSKVKAPAKETQSILDTIMNAINVIDGSK
jgi:Txe/YoeB family toxin of Txe-Axe toxin-antitoxin module